MPKLLILSIPTGNSSFLRRMLELAADHEVMCTTLDALPEVGILQSEITESDTHNPVQTLEDYWREHGGKVTFTPFPFQLNCLEAWEPAQLGIKEHINQPAYTNLHKHYGKNKRK